MAAPRKRQHTQIGRARDGQRPPYSTLSPLVHSPDPVSVYCSSVPVWGTPLFSQLTVIISYITSLLWIKLLHIIQFSISDSRTSAASSTGDSQFPFWGYPCFICSGIQLMTPSPFSSYHGLVHSYQQPLQSILLSGPFCHRRKPVPFWLFAICILAVSQHRKPPRGFGCFCSCPSVLHGSEAVCECIPCPAHPEAPLPCCPMYAAPGRLLYFPWDPVNHSPKATFQIIPCWLACHLIMLILEMNGYFQ